MTCPVPIILYEDARATNVVQIHESYHGETAGRSDQDPRADQRLKKALQALGKLKE